MHLALTCRSLAVPGGRERDCLEIASGLARLGHRVTLITTEIGPQAPAGPGAVPVDIVTLAGRGLSNHAQVRTFSADLAAWQAANPVDAVIGFDRMAGLDFHYSADQPWPRHDGLRALLPRNRTYLEFERAVFGPASGTYVFFLAQPQASNYVGLYGLEPGRFEVLPPFVRNDRALPADFDAARARVRHQLAIPQGHAMLVQVALYGQQKGTDRVIDALAGIPDATLVCVGLQNPRRVRARASRRGVEGRLRTVAFTGEVGGFIAAADLMVHPARVETTGSVILESLLYGTPVVASAVCGYAEHVERSGAGMVTDEPFEAKHLTWAIASCLKPPVLADMTVKARDYARLIAASFGIDAVTGAVARAVANRAYQSRT